MWERGQPVVVSLQVAKRRPHGLDAMVRWRVEFDAPADVGKCELSVSMLDELDGRTYEAKVEAGGRERTNIVRLAVGAICAVRFGFGDMPAPKRPGYRWDRVDLTVTIYGLWASAIPLFRLSIDAKSRSSVAIYWDTSVALGLTTRPRTEDDVDPITLALTESLIAGAAAPRPERRQLVGAGQDKAQVRKP